MTRKDNNDNYDKNDKPNGDQKPPPKKREAVTIEQLRRQRIAKKRYGRATLTIRRWGGITTLGGETELERSLNRFRAGEDAAEDVAWAYVRARVESHSPTFSWKDADLGRLVKLVTDCSKSPHFEAQTADELAAELAKVQDEEREKFERTAARFAESFSGLNKISKLFQPQIAPWAAQQQKLFAALSRGFVTPALNKQLLANQSLTKQMSSFGLTPSVRKAMFPTLNPGITSALAAGTLSSQALYGQRVRLPDSLYESITKPLRKSLTPYRVPTPALDALTRHQSFTIGQALAAAQEATTVAQERGERRQAKALTALREEVVAVVEAPSVEKIERIIGDLSKQLNDRLDTLEKHLNDRLETIEEQQAANHREAQNLAVFIAFLQICLVFFFYLLGYVPKK
jgi:hypothetical protein